MLVRDIVERSSSSSKPPAPPRAPSESQAFPPVLHRSQRKSQFVSRIQSQPPPVTPYEPQPEAGPSRVRPISASKAREYDTIQESVDEENRKRVEAMTREEREEEIAELKERFGEGIVGLMRRRKAAREAKAGVSDRQPPIDSSRDPGGGTDALDSQQRRKAIREVERIQDVAGMESQSRGKSIHDRRQIEQMELIQSENTAHSSPSAQGGVTRPSQADVDRYFPNATKETDKLAWLLPPSTASTDTSPRFDLSGDLISKQAAQDLPVHLGLHHHGSSPDLAGYTIDDMIYLCQSSVPAQRIAMLSVFAKVIRHYLVGKFERDALEICSQTEICKKGCELGVMIAEVYSKNAGMLKAGVELLYESLGGSQWDFEDDERFQPELPGTGIELNSLPWDDLLPTISEVLNSEGSVSPRTTQQLIAILRRLPRHSQVIGEAVVAYVPQLVQAKVLQRSSDSPEPSSINILCLLLELVRTSRVCASEIVRSGVVESLLKYPLCLSWDTTEESQVLAILTLKIMNSLGRYGLLTSIAKTGREAFQWLSSNSPVSDISVAFLSCLETWVVCATDPHSTTPEHDLTWAELSALGYIDDVLARLPEWVKAQKWAEVGHALLVLIAWIKGSQVNGIRGGEAEKEKLMITISSDMVDQIWNADLQDECPQHNLIELASLLSPQSILSDDRIKSSLNQQLHPASARYHLLLLAHAKQLIDHSVWLSTAVDIFQNFKPGDEPFALDLLDIVLKTKPATSVADLETISHKDKLQILRPLLQYTILPDLTNVVGPTRPDHHYLKATSTLRHQSPSNPKSRRAPGLPLSRDWLFSPLNELLSSATSPAIAQTPPDWQPSETDLVKSTMILAKLAYTRTSHSESMSLSPSEILLNVMKVYMLEHGQHASTSTSQSDVFRDPTVSNLLKHFVDLTCDKQQPNHSSIRTALNLEEAAISFLGPETPFFQFYSDFVALYEAISFSDPTFTRLLLPPLSMTYPVDYRRLFWSDHGSIIRGIRTKADQIPIESSRGVLDFYAPVETNQDVLSGMVRALARGWVREDTFLWDVAIWHLAQCFWTFKDEVKDNFITLLLQGMFSTVGEAVIKAVVTKSLVDPLAALPVDQSEIQRRRDIVARLAGAKGLQRFDNAST